MRIKEDKREKLWREIEASIQKKSSQKDKKFRLTGKWKKFLKKDSGYKVYRVDGKWIRTNLCCYFGHGGHGFVHEFIPMDEIWISTHHYNEGPYDLQKCNCKTRTKNQKASDAYFKSTTLHEITECEWMKKGKSFWESHNLALEAEEEAGFLDDPYADL
jgi:hypothetical protein